MPPRHAVAAGHPLVAEAAARMLASGGNAVDACVAGALAACVVEPALAGLMGGGVMMVREPSGRARLLDFFAHAPRRRRRDDERAISAAETLPDADAPARPLRLGAATIAAPGLASGLSEAHARLGRMPFRDLAAPAIEAAAGAPLSASQARLLARHAPVFAATPEARALFHPEPDRLIRVGETLRNPALADVLDAYASEGVRFLQAGEPAEMLCELAARGGHLTRDDLAAYAPVWRDPLHVLRGPVRLSLDPGPGGFLIALALDLAGRTPDPTTLARALAAASEPRLDALLREALAPDSRPDFFPPLAPETLAGWAALAPAARTRTDGASVSAVDLHGMTAVLTLTNGAGCGTVIPGLGIMPNNLLGAVEPPADAREAEFPETWSPDRRLAHALAPAMVEWPNGTVAALGATGPAHARAALIAVLLGLLDRAEPLDLALAAPRLDATAAPFAPGSRSRYRAPPEARFEDAFPEPRRDALVETFPQAAPAPPESFDFGAVIAIRRAASGAVEAAAEPRREGVSRTG